MRHFKITLLFIICCFATVNAQILWKISGNGLEKPSYIFGTHHVAPLSILDGIADFKDSFNSCTQMCGEVDMTDMADIQMKSVQMMMAPADSTLDKVLSPADYKIVGEAVKTFMGMDLAQFNVLKPSAVSNILTITLMAQTFEGFDPQKQIDATIQKMAGEKQMTIKGFETPMFQLETLFSPPIKEQAESLMKMLRDQNKFKEYSKLMADLYKAQDIDKLYEIFDDPDLGCTPDEMERLIFKRNYNWVKQIPDMIKANPTFIVVGAGHLPGDKGLISLLRNEGYTLTPMK